MMTSLKKSHDVGYHFDLFWKNFWWIKYLPRLKWIGQVLLEKTRGVIPPPATRSDTADPNSEVEIGLSMIGVYVHHIWLGLTIIRLSVHYLQKCLIFEDLIDGKSYNFISFYRSPSQSSDSFEEFADNLQHSLDKISNQNPFLTAVLDDFNTKFLTWCKHNKTTYEDSKIDGVTSQFGQQQLIKETINILEISSSYIDLIFTSHPSVFMELDVHPWLRSNCHHQTTYAKFNMKIHYPHH